MLRSLKSARDTKETFESRMNITKFVVSHRENALLIGDYKTYQHQLTKQLASLRKKLGRATPKNGKYTKKPAVTAEDIGRNHEFVYLLLLSAERAYAHAMSMKSGGTEDGTGLSSATRLHIASRINKAANHARQLAALLSIQELSTATETDILEAKAYAYAFAGAKDLEKHGADSRSSDIEVQREKWASCLESFSASRVIYVALFKSTKEDVLKEYVASTIDPSIRFAAYQSHIPRTVTPVTVSRKYFPKDEKELMQILQKLDPTAFSDQKAAEIDGGAEVPNRIKWRSRTANIVDTSIGQALAAVKIETGRLQAILRSDDVKDKYTIYDPVLIAAQDAVDATRHAIDDHEKERVSESDPRMQELRIINLAVNYELIGWRVGRNRELIGSDDGMKLSNTPIKRQNRLRKDGKIWAEKSEGKGRKLVRLRERIVLYNAILQSLDSVKDVPGAMGDPAFVGELEGKKAYFQALKCLNLSFSHTLVSPPAHKHALALIIRAEQFSSQAKESLLGLAPSDEASPLRLEISKSRLTKLHNLIKSYHLQTRALVELQDHLNNSPMAARNIVVSAEPRMESPDDYTGKGDVGLVKLVEWPPKLKPIPLKPLFFDTAWNYVEYPGKAPAATAITKEDIDEAKKEEKPSSKGWFGFGRR
ncbi:uncharacterized protein PV09_08273 [Verruconis gallopava]|uniref:Signal recognition particle subunit SRP68 n=1 Tax=Verruconis gallopava TaxID=253628 RepID=A0A0D1YH07_9PEZI|nr:uncharacterized protein PV09_08273 [Verruconis gallopava]KIW00087.1 hypothetical protein PV09_08273 [Verruconis gallopava]